VLLDGHSLELKFSQRKEEIKTRERKQTKSNMLATNKLLVKNLPFQASPKELKDLFG